MDSIVPKIKDRLSIVEVISLYLKIEKAGKNYKAKCPFHNEKTPSFSISPDRGIYYCFGCGAKGDIFSFVQHFEGTNFIGALKILAERAGIEIPRYQNKDKDKTEILYDIMEHATTLYEKALIDQKEVAVYLLGRGLNYNSIKSFRIGYAPESWNFVFDYLVKKGYKKEDIEKVGLIKEKDNRFYDRFRGRIMFPISDSTGRVIAFSGRILELKPPKPPVGLVGVPTSPTGGESSIVQAKYLNSPETPLFNKSNVLFGLDKAKSSIRSRDYSIIVEGQIDLILSHQSGFTNTVAVSGTAFAENITDNELKINNLGLVRRLSSNIIFAYDGDDAGIRAVNRSAMIALSLDMQVKVAIFPKGKDPADIIQEDYKKWEEIIKKKTDIISFHLDKICENTKDKESRRKQILEKVFPFITMIESSIKKSNYIKEISEKASISENAIIEDYKKYEKLQNININFNKEKKEDIDNSKSRRSSLEKRLFSIIFWGGENIEEKNIINEIKTSFIENIGKEQYQKIFNLYEPFSENLVFEGEKWYSGKIKVLSKEMKEISLNLEEEILNEESYSILIKIREKERNKEDIKTDLITYQKIVEKIEEIKNNRAE